MARGETNELLLAGLSNGTHGPYRWKGGAALTEIYGTWDGASATMQYASNGATGDFRDVAAARLVGRSTDVRLEPLTMAKGWWFQLVVAGGGGSESLTWSCATTEAP